MKEQERVENIGKGVLKEIRDFEHNLRIRGSVTVKLKVFYLKNKLGAKTNMIT